MSKNILIYNSGGGLGDSIQLFSLILSLQNYFEDRNFYYLSAHENHFEGKLKEYNIQINNLNLGLKYFGFRWWHALVLKKKIRENNIKPFELIIDFQSKIRNSLILKMLPHKSFISPCFNFKLSKPNLIVKKEKKIYNTILNAINFLLNKNYYINDFNIKKINKEFFIESEKLLPNNNYVGLSITHGNINRKKEWPLKNIIELSNKLIEYKKIPVFFIEKKNYELKDKIKKMLPLALFPEHESNMSSPALVTCLGERLDFAVTIDNGVMHMLSLSKVPMISLFGPTNSEKFAPEYDKSIILDSKKLHNTKDITSISVEDVLLAVRQRLNFLN